MTVPTLQLHTSATVELDSQKNKSVPFAIFRSATLRLIFMASLNDGGMSVTAEIQDMTPIQEELVRSDENIYCIKFSDLDIITTAKLKGIIDEIVPNGCAGGSEGTVKAA